MKMTRMFTTSMATPFGLTLSLSKDEAATQSQQNPRSFDGLRMRILGAALLTTALIAPANAELFIDLRGGNFQPMPIAIADCIGDTPQQSVSGVVTNDLKRSGLFSPIEKSRHPEKIENFDAAPNFAAWKGTGIQALVTCRMVRNGGQVQAQYRLWEVASGEQLVGQQLSTDGGNWRRAAHIIADGVFAKITGEKGFFDTRIVFVDESGPKENRKKRLAIIDSDGGNFRRVSRPPRRKSPTWASCRDRTPRSISSMSRPAAARSSAISPA
jgi:tol-pal system beta propeller repeat protein TolB